MDILPSRRALEFSLVLIAERAMMSARAIDVAQFKVSMFERVCSGSISAEGGHDTHRTLGASITDTAPPPRRTPAAPCGGNC